METPTTFQDIITDLDDTRLEEMARPPRERLFPLLRHAAAMKPLVVLVAILPGVIALRNAPWTTVGTTYALQQLHLSANSTPLEFWEVGGAAPELARAGKAPLSAWLGALGLQLLGTDLYGAYLLIPLLCVAGIVICSSFLAQHLGGTRMGIFSALLIAFQSPTIQLAQEPGPIPLAVFALLMAFWGLSQQWKEQTTSFSLWVLIAGIGLGASFLTIGPITLVALGCLICCRLGSDLLLRRRETPQENPQKRRRQVERAWRSLWIALAIGMLLAGPWILWMLLRYGIPFLGQWGMTVPRDLLSKTDQTVSPTALPEWSTRWETFPGILSGFMVLGAWSCWRGASGEFVEGEVRRQFENMRLLIWSTFALLGWGIVALTSAAESPLWILCRTLALVPWTMLAAKGIVDIANRTFSVMLVMLAGLAGVLILIAQLIPFGRSLAPLWESGGVTGLVLLLLICGVWILIRRSRSNETQERRLLSLMTMACCCLSLGLGFSFVPRATADDQELQQLRQDLHREWATQQIIFVTPDSPPSQLELLCCGIWPQAEVIRVHDWNAAMNEALRKRPKPPAATHCLIVCWNISDSRRFKDLPNVIPVQLVGLSRIYHQRDLNVFRCDGNSPSR